MDNHFSSFIIYLYPPCCLSPRQWRFSTIPILVHKVTEITIGGLVGLPAKSILGQDWSFIKNISGGWESG